MQDRELRSGFTTGTCGTAAAKAAAVCLLTGEIRTRIEVMTPGGVLAVLDVQREAETGFFGVQKDSGDDPDVTDRAWIWASVEKWEQDAEPMWYQSETYPHLYLTGGEGIGVVTKPGLSCPVGKHAINPVPRKMIFEAAEAVCEEMEYVGDLIIRIRIPEGKNLAEKTFNPRLGIVGGISVLGTSGIVKPMSQQALIDTICLELHMKAIEGIRDLILTPGNYGETFLQETLGLSMDFAVTCSNFAADTMEAAEREGFQNVLFVGHLGKLIKIAGGVRNTHSQYGDRRMEILADCTACAGGNASLCQRILESNTTEEAVAYLKADGCLNQVMAETVARIKRELTSWSHGKIRIEVVTFSTIYGILGNSEGAEIMMEHFRQEVR